MDVESFGTLRAMLFNSDIFGLGGPVFSEDGEPVIAAIEDSNRTTREYRNGSLIPTPFQIAGRAQVRPIMIANAALGAE
jgi:hypothetical protein